MAVAEADDAAMFQEAADDALDADIVRQAGHAGPQAADAAHHQFDPHAGLAGAIERVDHVRIDQRIELDPDRGRPARAGVHDFLLDAPRSDGRAG